MFFPVFATFVITGIAIIALVAFAPLLGGWIEAITRTWHHEDHRQRIYFRLLIIAIVLGGLITILLFITDYIKVTQPTTAPQVTITP